MQRRGEDKLLGLDISMVELSECGVSLPLSSDAMREINRIAVMIQQNRLPELIEEYDTNIDKLAFYAYTACSYGDISTEQLATVLEIRSIKQLNPLHFSIEKIDSDSLSNPDSAITEYINSAYTSESTQKTIFNNFLTTLQAKHSSDAYCIKFSFSPSDFTKQEMFNSYLELGKILKAAHFEIPSRTGAASDNPYSITWLSAGARDAITQTVYLSNAKKVFFYYGKGIDREMIRAGIEKGGRYTATTFPGVKDPSEFHKLKTPAFFLTLHDEFHRQLISAIPNPVYDAIVQTIELLRETTKREWSPEIWQLQDMDFAPFNLRLGSPTIDPSLKETTNQFFQLISGVATDYAQLSVFLPSPYCDTTWLILMDIAGSPEKWIKRGVNPAELPSQYQSMYDFIKANIPQVSSSLSYPQKLLKLKCDYLGIPYPESAAIKFSQRMKGKAVDIEVLVDDNPYLYKKSDLMKFLFIHRVNSLIITIIPEIEKALHVLIEKLSDKSDKIKTAVLDYLSKADEKGLLLLILLSNVDKDKINQTVINELISLIDTLHARTPSLLQTIRIQAGMLSEITPDDIKQLLMLPPDFYNTVVQNLARLHHFFAAINTLQLNLADITSIETQYPRIASFIAPQTNTLETRKRDVYLKNLRNLSSNDKIFYITSWPEVSVCCVSLEDVEHVFKLNHELLFTIDSASESIARILETSKIDFITLTNQYKELFDLQTAKRDVLKPLSLFIFRKKITLIEFFSYDKETRKNLLVRLANQDIAASISTLCRQLQINLKDIIALDKESNGMLINHSPALVDLVYKNPLSLEELNNFLKKFSGLVPQKEVKATLTTIINKLTKGDKPLSVDDLLQLRLEKSNPDKAGTEEPAKPGLPTFSAQGKDFMASFMLLAQRKAKTPSQTGNEKTDPTPSKKPNK